MGKRRRKLLRRKYNKLSWNKYYENLKKKNEQPQEQTMVKVVEDNSVMIEKMKNVSTSCDKILQAIDTINQESEITNSAIIEPQFLSTEPAPQFQETPNNQDLKKMLKKDLLNVAKEIGCDVKPAMTKANIIEAIEGTR